MLWDICRGWRQAVVGWFLFKIKVAAFSYMLTFFWTSISEVLEELVLLVIIGWLVVWLVGWLVGNAGFSETTLRIFLIFCMKLRDYKDRKVTEPDFWKQLLIWNYSQKDLQISPKSDTLIFFSKAALTIFLVFGLKLVLNLIFNLNET